MRTASAAGIPAPALLALALSALVPARLPAGADSGGVRSLMVPARQGTALEVVDFGGSGPPLLLLADLGATAHIYEDFAPAFCDSYRVFGLTRRGFGVSGLTLEGYRTPDLAADIAAVVDSLGLAPLVLIGTGMAGPEMTTFALEHPDQVRGLVYLDAAMNRMRPYEMNADVPYPQPQPLLPGDLDSAETLQGFYRRTQGWRMPLGELRATWRFDEEGRALGPVTPREIYMSVRAGLQEVDFSRVRAPVLALFSIPTLAGLFPGYEGFDQENRARAEQAVLMLAPRTERMIARFSRDLPAAEVVELPGAGAHMFLTRRDRVVEEIRAYLRALPGAQP